MYLAKMYIETAIPKNVYVASFCVSRTGPHTVLSQHTQFVLLRRMNESQYEDGADLLLMESAD